MISLITPAAQAILPALASALTEVANFAFNIFPKATGVTVYVHLPQESTPLSAPNVA